MAISEQLLDGINTLQIGNSRGFDVIYNETSSYVYARARMIMKDEQDANDLVQDTYIQAYQNINSLQDPQNIFAKLQFTVNEALRSILPTDERNLCVIHPIAVFYGK